MNLLKLVSPIPPSVNHYLGWRAIMKKGKPIVVSYEKPEAKTYKKEFGKYVADAVKEQFWDLPVTKTQHFYFDCVFYFDRLDKDPNNYFKCMLDAITEQGCIWDDDNVVCERVNAIYYDSKNPRIEITVYPVDYIGIFNSKEALESFTNNCNTCNRYKDGVCSIYKKSLEGRIQDEINSEYVCSKYKKKN